MSNNRTDNDQLAKPRTSDALWEEYMLEAFRELLRSNNDGSRRIGPEELAYRAAEYADAALRERLRRAPLRGPLAEWAYPYDEGQLTIGQLVEALRQFPATHWVELGKNLAPTSLGGHPGGKGLLIEHSQSEPTQFAWRGWPEERGYGAVTVGDFLANLLHRISGSAPFAYQTPLGECFLRESSYVWVAYREEFPALRPLVGLALEGRDIVVLQSISPTQQKGVKDEG